jgi:hypothetical protein
MSLEEHIRRLGLGPTGQFPDGRPLGASDRGGLKTAIRTYEDQIVIVFGTAVEWLTMAANEAVQMAEMLIKNARKIATSQSPS